MRASYTAVLAFCLLLCLSTGASADVCFFGDNAELEEIVAEYDNVTVSVSTNLSLVNIRDYSGKCGWVLVYMDAPDSDSGKDLKEMQKFTFSISSMARFVDVIWSGYPPELRCVSGPPPAKKKLSNVRISVPYMMDSEETVDRLSVYEIDQRGSISGVGMLYSDELNETIAYRTLEKRIYYMPFDLSDTPHLTQAIALNYRDAPMWVYQEQAEYHVYPENSLGSNLTIWDGLVFGALMLLALVLWMKSRSPARKQVASSG